MLQTDYYTQQLFMSYLWAGEKSSYFCGLFYTAIGLRSVTCYYQGKDSETLHYMTLGSVPHVQIYLGGSFLKQLPV